ncbi:MAG: PTS system mannose/fructose/sorbose family transporter subunit IID [Defluviitaleaceae bacterium]|nr:PTS system mannose/fructose/sorbose family transporter subunit IID [Defluviitaleaceae bacterium]
MKREKLTNKDLWKIFRRQIFIRSCLNFERHQALGFANAMSPVFDKYYQGQEKVDAMERHMQLFLTQPMVSAIPVGVAAAMEESIALEGNVEPDSVNAVKSALMGPLAALGDSLINGTARPLLAGIAVGLALQGNILGPILFFIGMSIITLGVRYYGVFRGYKYGVNIVGDLQKSGLINKITDLAAVAAFVIIGGFVPAVVSLNLSWSYVVDAYTTISLQDALDGLIPGLLPVAVTMLMYFLLTKKKANPIMLMMLLMAIGIVGVYAGIL